MRGRSLVLAGIAALIAPVGVAHAQTTTTAPAGPPPKAYVVVDQASGVVVASSNDRVPLPPASLTKILTALVAVAALPVDSGVPVSARAAGMPAHKLSMKAGETWKLEDVLHALLVSSANDAGAALAERVSGSLENFDVALGALGRHLQFADAPTLQDPSGLDDNFSVGGGNLISARDLAIATRALLAEPRLAPIVAEPISRFTDPGGIPHRLVNHNKLLTRYAGAIGVKTGFTKKAGRGLIAAATRNGSTKIAVVLGVGDTYGWAASLLDNAFATPLPSTGDRLPAIRPALRLKAAASSVTAAPAVTQQQTDSQAIAATPVAAHGDQQGLPLPLTIGLVVVAALALAVVVLRARVLIRRRYRRRRRATARVRRHVNRRRHPRLTPHYEPHDQLADRFHAAGRE
jgi:D-alanyl-D-alanine carboxypeptidase